MNKRVVLLWICLFVWAVSLMAKDVPKGAIEAFKKGNSQELNGYLSEKVELVLENCSTNVDRTTAVTQMSGFFSDNKVENFVVNHKGNRHESSFIVGTLTTGNGNFRVNCLFKKINDKYVINRIRIDKINE